MASFGDDFLDSAIKQLQLGPLQAQALEIIARDAIGIIQSAASSQVSSQTNRSRADCDQALIDLLGRGLLIRVDKDQPRLLVDYSKLGISAEQRELIVRQPPAFRMLGQPHSAEAMATLSKAFDDSPEAIFICMEVTSRDVFSALESRSASGRSTVFLMPPKSKVGPQRREHYDEVVGDWVKFLKNGPAHLRTNVKVFVSKQLTPEIYTSALTPDAARVDVYWFCSGSTRTGNILETKSGSSLYALVEAKYRSALAEAIPLFRVWPQAWCVAYLKRFGVLAFGLVVMFVAMVLSWGHAREAGVAFLIGAAANFVTQFKLTSGPVKEIYK